jgi:hypothetical protein
MSVKVAFVEFCAFALLCQPCPGDNIDLANEERKTSNIDMPEHILTYHIMRQYHVMIDKMTVVKDAAHTSQVL